MKIDEPDTPWASPPKELFEDPAEQENDVAMDDVAERLKHVEGPRAAGDGRPSSAGADAPPPDASISAKKDDEWESSDDEGEGGSKGGRVALDPGALSDPTTGGGSDENDDDIIDEGPLDEYDRMLRARLFEAQRKSHQCTFRGVMAKGRALLEEEDDGGRVAGARTPRFSKSCKTKHETIIFKHRSRRRVITGGRMAAGWDEEDGEWATPVDGDVRRARGLGRRGRG